VDSAEAVEVLTHSPQRKRRSAAEVPEARLIGNPPIPAEIVDACSLAMHNVGGRGLTRLGVTSAVRGEGRTSVANAMALAHARDYGRSALLIDADFDGPNLNNLYGLPSTPGIAEVLSGRASLDAAVHHVNNGITVMTSGEVPPIPARLATKLVQSGLLDELQANYDIIVVDLPPIRYSSSGPLLAEAFKSLLLVIRANETPLTEVREAIELLDNAPALILNGTQSSLPRWVPA
jgi:capsular exopolysaccharide synthesis family protein